MMVRSLVFFLFFVGVLGGPPGGFYHQKYDHLDLDDVLNNKRLVYHYANCLLSREPCPPQGTELKEILPEALQTNCLRCTEKQKAFVSHVIYRLKNEYPDVWKEMSDLWDPTGENLRKFEAAFSAPNALSNRFVGEEDSNEVAGSLKPAITTTTTRTTTRSKLRPSVVITSTLPSSTTSRAVFWWVNNVGPSKTQIRPLQNTWIGEVGSKVIQAGTQVAEMVLSTFQAALGS